MSHDTRRPRAWPFAALLVLLAGVSPAAAAPPTADDLVSLRRPGSTAISPDGRRVAFTVRETSWKDDEYQLQVWLADAAGGDSRPLTRSRKWSEAPALSAQRALGGTLVPVAEVAERQTRSA